MKSIMIAEQGLCVSSLIAKSVPQANESCLLFYSLLPGGHVRVDRWINVVRNARDVRPIGEIHVTDGSDLFYLVACIGRRRI